MHTTGGMKTGAAATGSGVTTAGGATAAGGAIAAGVVTDDGTVVTGVVAATEGCEDELGDSPTAVGSSLDPQAARPPTSTRLTAVIPMDRKVFRVPLNANWSNFVIVDASPNSCREVQQE
ncbi:MAG: hypothetical protein WBQ44_15755 [Rhodococcus sp. (in: high G+C Gram-positive bacteria)]